MNNKLLVTESEKEQIKKLHGLNEQEDLNPNPLLISLIKKAMELAKGGSDDTDSSDDLNDVDFEVSDTEKTDSEPLDLSKVSAKGQALLKNPIFQKKLKEISQAINIDENSIIKLMKHESGLDPTIKNSIGCVGLIQFCPVGGVSSRKVKGKNHSLEELRNNLELQMDAIKEFWQDGYRNGKIKSPSDLYIYNFFPVAAGKGDNFILQAKGLSATTVAKANPVFNRTLGKPSSSPLTVGDLKKYYQKTGMV